MPDPQDTGDPPAAASLTETGTPPGQEGGGTAQPQTQADQSTQQGRTVSLIQFEPPFNPLDQDEGEWDHEEEEIDALPDLYTEETTPGNIDDDDGDSNSDPHKILDTPPGLPKLAPGATNRESFVQHFTSMLSEISITEESQVFPTEVEDALNVTLPQLDDEEALAAFGRRLSHIALEERTARNRVVRHMGATRDKMEFVAQNSKEPTIQEATKRAVINYD